MPYSYHNPIIPGYHPDPSICRVGKDFYLVNSTFEFFPGVPVFHSTNLANWELTGYCLTRRSQLELEGCRNSGGIYAPTIRHHKNMFYMITTNVTDRGHFIVHTPAIGTEWSEPVWIDQEGIDPSLFWDQDDRCYFCSTGHINGIRGIVGFEIDPMTGEILSDKHLLTTGCGGPCTEGPHIYRRHDWYYLLFAEGGTEYAHSACIQRSRTIWGPYESCPDNPILTQRQCKGAEIQATGHADLTEDENGNWWLVCLGIRRFSHALLHNLGRETFLSPVTWSENDWPVVGNKGDGTISTQMEGPLPAPEKTVCHDLYLDFQKPQPDLHLQFTRNPDLSCYRWEGSQAALILQGTAHSLNEAGVSPTVLSFQQPDFTTSLSASLQLSGSNAQRCGISAYYNNDYHYDLYLGTEPDGQHYIGFYKHIHDMGVELAHLPLTEAQSTSSGSCAEQPAARLLLRIDSDREGYHFSWALSADTRLGLIRQLHTETGAMPEFHEIGSGLNAGLSTEGTRTMTFTGTMFSLFAENGTGIFTDGVSLRAYPDYPDSL